jgi:hypothetical protein
VAESVPSDDLDAIPPSAPVYNVKYVRIYDVTPDVVWFGYTPGYTGVYPWHGTVVWGTGWRYRPWAGPVYWWPRPYTWGLSAHYNPWTGWGFGYSWSYPFFNVSSGWGGWFRPRGWYRPAYAGSWHRPGGWGWYGPGGYRPPAAIAGSYWSSHGGNWNRPLPAARTGAVRPFSGPMPGVHAGLGFRPPAREIRTPAQANIYTRLPAKTRDFARSPAAFERPKISAKTNDVYADKNGEVYRRTKQGQWQQREGDRWKSSGGAAVKSAGGSGGAGAGGATGHSNPTGKQPVVTSNPSTPKAWSAPKDLDRDFSARQRGDARVRDRNVTSQGNNKVPSPQPQSTVHTRAGDKDKDKKR